MEQPRIGIICTNNKMADSANSILALSDNKALLAVTTGQIAEALPIAIDMISKGIEVIITRSVTAVMLRASVNIPILDMGIKTIDILKAVKKASIYGERVGIIVYDDVIYDIDIIKYMLGLNIVPIIFNMNDTLEEKDEKVYKKLDEMDVAVGGSIALEILTKYGVKGVQIETEKESISQSLQEAKTILEVTKLERQRIQELNTIFNYSHEGVVKVDKNGLIKIYNGLAEKVFKKRATLVIGTFASDSLPQINFSDVIRSEKPVVYEVITIGDNTVVANTIPIKTGDDVLGAIFLFQEISKIQKLEGKARLKLNEQGYVAKYKIDDIITGCNLMLNVTKKIPLYAKVNSTILVIGETGTGKEIVAQSIHNASPRADMPFVAINCGALPDNLLESELFGYEEGAFTGAKKGGKTGLFECAHRGTIFLDEIGEISEKVQLDLLRVLEEKQIMRVGGNKLIHIDVRVICATNKNLNEEVKNKNFREDLYYRLNVLTINIPPLRQRRESIPIFIDVFLKKLCAENKVIVKSISPRAIEYLVNYDWPGNVRELQNFVERLVVSIHKDTIDIDDILSMMDVENVNSNNADSVINVNIARSFEKIERDILISVLNITGNNHTKTAEMLDISRATLWRKIKKHLDP